MNDDLHQANAAMRASLGATHAKLDAAGISDPAMRLEDRVESVLNDLALAVRSSEEIALECVRLRRENEDLKEAARIYRAYWEPIHKNAGDAYTRQGGELATLQELARQVCASAARELNYTDDVLFVDAPALRRLRAALGREGE